MRPPSSFRFSNRLCDRAIFLPRIFPRIPLLDPRLDFALLRVRPMALRPLLS